MERLEITKEQARLLLLGYQQLLPPYNLKGKEGILQYIEQVGSIQFDPLNIVGRNPELVLQSRISNFKPEMLNELLYQDRQLLDGWDKMMCIYRVTDWPYFTRYRRTARAKYGDPSRAAVKILPEVRHIIESRGPVSSLELDFNQTTNWAWAPTRIARAALESMYFWGELIVHHRINTRKVYDFAYRHLPPGLLAAPDPNQQDESYRDWHVLRRIGSVGLLWGRSSDAWLEIPGVKSKERAPILNRLHFQGELVQLKVAGIDSPLYMRSKDFLLLKETFTIDKPPQRASIIAPLDNLIWDRRLIKELFNFEYRWEVYKPVEARRYGYYVLPILYGDQFIGRFEPGRDKATGKLIIKNWWWEPGIKQTKKLQRAIKSCFEKFLHYLKAEGLIIEARVLEQKNIDWLKEL